MGFNHKKILDKYENVELDESYENGLKYIFSNSDGIEYLELYVLNFNGNENELRFLHKYSENTNNAFSTNIPLRNIRDFESLFKRMKIEIPIKNN